MIEAFLSQINPNELAEFAGCLVNILFYWLIAFGLAGLTVGTPTLIVFGINLIVKKIRGAK